VADRQGAIRHEEAGASVAGQRPAAAEDLAVVGAQRLTAGVAGIGKRSLAGVRALLRDRLYLFFLDNDIWKWREAICDE